METDRAEYALIGALLLNAKRAGPMLIDGMDPERLANDLVRRVYNLAIGMFCQHGYVRETPLIYSMMQEFVDGETTEESCKMFLDRCVEDAGSVEALPSYIKIVNDSYKAGYLSGICAEYAFGHSFRTDTIDEQLEKIATDIAGLLAGNRNSGLVHIKDLAVQQYVRLFDKDSLRGNVYTGFKKLDKFTNGFRKKQFVVLAARPGVGKSALALNWSLAFARQGKRVALFSLEMSKDELYERYMAHMAPANLGVIQQRDFGDSTSAKLSRASNEIMGLDLLINDAGSVTVEQIRMEAKIKKVDVVIVDYLQLIRPVGRHSTRNEEVSTISRALKEMAMELDIPVVALSQLNRKKDEDQEPHLNNLRDSGSIEQDANIVIMLWDAGIEPIGSEQYLACKVAKIRNGMRGEVVLEYRGGVMTMVETDKQVYRGPRRKKTPMPWEEPEDEEEDEGFTEVDDQQVFH